MTGPLGDAGAAGSPDENGSLVPIRPSGRRSPLYCVHPVSGSPYVYAGLARLLEEDQPVWGFEAPGYDDDRKPLTSFDALAAEYLPALRRARPGGPYLLLGWSLGGSLAFYLAQQLAASGAPVPVLVLVDATVPFRSPLPVEREMLRKFLHDLLALGGLPAAGLDEIVARFPAEVARSTTSSPRAATTARSPWSGPAGRTRRTCTGSGWRDGSPSTRCRATTTRSGPVPGYCTWPRSSSGRSMPAGSRVYHQSVTWRCPTRAG